MIGSEYLGKKNEWKQTPKQILDTWPIPMWPDLYFYQRYEMKTTECFGNKVLLESFWPSKSLPNMVILKIQDISGRTERTLLFTFYRACLLKYCTSGLIVCEPQTWDWQLNLLDRLFGSVNEEEKANFLSFFLSLFLSFLPFSLSFFLLLFFFFFFFGKKCGVLISQS